MSLSDTRLNTQLESRAMLEGFWPAAFRFSAPRPLKIGIFEDLLADVARRGLPFDTGILKQALKVYTTRYVYQRALSKQDCRFDLDGNPAGKVSAEQKARAYALVKRMERNEKARKAAADTEKAAKVGVSHPDA